MQIIIITTLVIAVIGAARRGIDPSNCESGSCAGCGNTLCQLRRSEPKPEEQKEAQA